jgi:hypothetical protein
MVHRQAILSTPWCSIVMQTACNVVNLQKHVPFTAASMHDESQHDVDLSRGEEA